MINIKKECIVFMKEFVCYRVKNFILFNIDIMKINRERKFFLKGSNNL